MDCYNITLIIFAIASSFLFFTEAVQKDDPKCIVDSTKDASEPGNYMDCLADEMVALVQKDDPKCIVDSTKDASEPGNYMDCLADEMVALGKTECCSIDGAVGCCKVGERWNQMIAIGVGIGVTFVVLATLCIYCLWCKKDTIPCLGRLQDRVEKKYYVLEEKLPCCASRVERRKMEEEIMRRSKDQPAFSLPPEAEIQDKTKKDDWWDGQFIKNM